jgi:hypothetical protein
MPDRDSIEGTPTLEDQVRELRDLIAAQQAEIAAQHTEIATLRAEVKSARPPAALVAMPGPSESSPAREPAMPARATTGGRGTSRRRLLTGAGAATAVTVALVASGQMAEASPAVDGDIIHAGETTTASSTTTLQAVVTASPEPLLHADNSTSTQDGDGIWGTASPGGSGVFGMGSGNDGSGFGGIGVSGTSFSTLGAAASSPRSRRAAQLRSGAVSPKSGIGLFSLRYGVLGQSDEFDLGALGTGRILQVPIATSGAPTSGSHFLGEQIRDGSGELWLCTSTGAPGTWVKAAHAVAGFTGGAISYLSKPIRLLDTRSGAGDALHNGGGPYAGGSTHALTIAGASFKGVTVPSGAQGAIGNVTVINPAGGGYLALVPHGAGFSGTAIMSFSAGQTVSNSFNVGLASGQLDIIIGSSSTDVILDLFAVVA